MSEHGDTIENFSFQQNDKQYAQNLFSLADAQMGPSNVSCEDENWHMENNVNQMKLKTIVATPISTAFILPNTQVENNLNEPRRRSMRDIKRPKFDDEIVESGQLIQPKPTPKRRQSNEKNGIPAAALNIQQQLDSMEDPNRPATYSRKKFVKNNIEVIDTENGITTQSQMPTKQIRKRKMSHQFDESDKLIANENNKTLSIITHWPPEDDIALIASVTHVADLWIVYSQMNFTRRYTFEQIEERWYELLYNKQTAQVAREKMAEIRRERIHAIQSKIPFSMAEEQLISQIPSNANHQPIFPQLQRLLEQNREIFHNARTTEILEEHWRELKSIGLLIDQRNQVTPPDEDNMIEEMYDLNSLAGLNPSKEQLPLDVEERQFTRSTIICERETKEWESVVINSITGLLPTIPVMTPETIAMFCGRCTTFDIRKERVLIGRSTKRHNVEVNLTLEGPTARISRKQAIFKLTDGGECMLRNIGKRHIIINGRILLQGDAAKLINNSYIEILLIKLKFIRNENYKKVSTDTKQ